MRVARIGCIAVLAVLLWNMNGCGETASFLPEDTWENSTAAQTTAAVSPDTVPAEPLPAETKPISPTVDPEAQKQESLAMQQMEAALRALPSVEAPGTLRQSGGGAVVDYSNTAQGYVMVLFEEEVQQRLKVQVKGPHTTYTYNLTPQQWTALPLSDENGGYQIVIYKNVSDSRYATVLSVSMQVEMADAFAPFLHANQYVNYDEAPNTVAKAAALTANYQAPLDKVAAVYHYVISNVTYDKELAATVKSGYLPQLDQVLEKKTGICFDYAALMTGMLRSQGIPTKLVVGYAGQSYHAWISVWTEQEGWVDGVIFFDGAAWHRMDPTFASSAGASEEIMDYIGDGKNYTAKYFY